MCVDEVPYVQWSCRVTNFGRWGFHPARLSKAGLLSSCLYFIFLFHYSLETKNSTPCSHCSRQGARCLTRVRERTYLRDRLGLLNMFRRRARNRSRNGTGARVGSTSRAFEALLLVSRRSRRRSRRVNCHLMRLTKVAQVLVFLSRSRYPERVNCLTSSLKIRRITRTSRTNNST